MSENTVPTVSQESGSPLNQQPTNQSPQIPPELQRELSLAFGEKPEIVTTPETVPSQNGVEGQPPTAAPPAADTEEEISFSEPDYLQANFGVGELAAIQAKLSELEQLREQAKTPAEIKYANEQSKKWHQYLQEGKEDELYNSLHARQQLKNLDGLTDEQKVKLYIKLNNPLFDQELIDYQFQKDYSFDESQFKDDEGNVIDPMGLRFAKVAAQQKMQNDVAKSNDYFQQYKTKIELPDINPQQSVDNNYESYKQSNVQAKEYYDNVIVPSVSSLKESDLPFNVRIDDANAQMQFDVSVVPEKDDFEAARKSSLNFGDYVQNSFYTDKGEFLAAKLQRAILLEKNFDKYAQSIARQAVNAERKRVVAKESGQQTGGKDFNVIQPEKTDFQKAMDMAYAV